MELRAPEVRCISEEHQTPAFSVVRCDKFRLYVSLESQPAGDRGACVTWWAFGRPPTGQARSHPLDPEVPVHGARDGRGNIPRRWPTAATAVGCGGREGVVAVEGRT